jgi:hypothetical protein
VANKQTKTQPTREDNAIWARLQKRCSDLNRDGGHAALIREGFSQYADRIDGGHMYSLTATAATKLGAPAWRPAIHDRLRYAQGRFVS